MRSLLDIANGYDVDSNLTRVKLLIDLGNEIVEEIRELNKYFGDLDDPKQELIIIEEIDRKGYPFYY